MEQDYSNREINRMFSEITEALVRIETQVLKTNGRVTALEFWKASVTGKVIGATAVISFLWTFVWYYFTQK